MTKIERHQDGHFRVGDLVTRDGTDIHRVTEADWEGGYAPDIITVVCVQEPLGFLNDDGSRGEPWTKVGESETNMARRYSHVGDVIDGEARQVHLIGQTSEAAKIPY
jgi:hypothetical protein